jgi:hypothetical protein
MEETMTATLPPGYSALRACLAQLAPDAINEERGSVGKNGFVTAASPLYAAWAPGDAASSSPEGFGNDEAASTAHDPLKAFNDIVDYIPEVSYLYRPSAMTVSQSYQFILDNLSFATSQNVHGLEALYAQQADLSKTIAALRSRLWNAYLASPQYPSVPFQVYLANDPSFQEYQLRVQQLGNLTLSIRKKLGPGGPLASAITEYNALVNPATAPTVIQPWRWGDVDVPELIQRWRRGLDLNPESVQSAGAEGSSTTNEYIDKRGGGSGFIVDLIAGGGSGSASDQRTINKQDEELGLELEVKAWANIPVVINDVGTGNKKWYNATLLRAYDRDLYFKAPLTGARAGAQPAYGPTGIYPWRIASVLVAFQPIVTITMGTSSYGEFYSLHESRSHWSAGPFGIFGSGSHVTRNETKNVSTDKQSRSVKIADTNENPVILGFIMEEVP